MTTSQLKQRRFVEDYASIDIGLLKRRGLFLPGGDRSVEVETRAGPFLFAYRHPEGRVWVKYGPKGRQTAESIELQVTQLRYGERRYFVCPISFTRASKLFMVDGRLASMVGHGLVHLATTNRKEDGKKGRTIHLAAQLKGDTLGKGAARGDRKNRLVKKLRALDSAKWVDPDVQAIVDRVLNEDSDRLLQEERARRARLNSTAHALEMGRVSPKGWTEEVVLRELADTMAMVAQGTPPVSPKLELFPEHLYPRSTLDVRALHTAGLLDPEELKAAALMWDRDYSGVINHTLLAADFRDPYSPFLVIENVDTYERKEYPQFIPIDFAGGRWYFKCPFTGRRCKTLYLREGWLGSEKALNLHRKPWDPALDPKETSDLDWPDDEANRDD